jgi:ribosomal protein S18 acetylase RimI-like enzyme
VVTHRAYEIGTITRVEVATASGSDLELRRQLVEWGLAFSRAEGAAAAQVWLASGQSGGMAELGLSKVRPWWRMDRTLEGDLPEVAPVPGYSLLIGPEVRNGLWSEVHNASFSDHWRYSLRGEEELMSHRRPELCLLAVDASGLPAAITLGQVETFAGDPRPQPVGLVSSVGTLPQHRRRGLARWLVTEIVPRLRNTGAKTASLYVDGMNPTGAPALYRSLGFEVTFETEVWEAVFP